jgi:hypothetical protein
VRLSRFLLIVLYMGYLVNAGLLFVMLPWSRVWGLLLSRFPQPLALVLDSPWLRGMLTAFGSLHLLLVAWELIHPTLLTTVTSTKTESQNHNQS